MTIPNLLQAGFSEQEIAEYNQRQNQSLSAAGFSNEEINDFNISQQQVAAEPEFVGPPEGLRQFFTGRGLETPEFTGTAPPRRRIESPGISVFGPQDVFTSQDPAITEGPGAQFTGAIAKGAIRQTQVPALLGRHLAPPETGSEKVGEFIGATTESIVELVTMGKLLKTVGFVGTGIVGKAAQIGSQFALTTGTQELRKGIAEHIHDDDFGFEGGQAVAKSFAFGFVFSIATTSAKAGWAALWARLKPTEQAQALRLLGLKKGATLEQINKSARGMAAKYHPDKVKGMRQKFEEVINARDVLRQETRPDIVFRGQKPVSRGRLIEGEVSVPTEIQPQVTTEPTVTPEIAKVVPPSKALKQVPTVAEQIEKPVVKPAKAQAQEIAPAKHVTPAKAAEVEGGVEGIDKAFIEGNVTEIERIAETLPEGSQAREEAFDLAFQMRDKAGTLGEKALTPEKRRALQIELQRKTDEFLSKQPPAPQAKAEAKPVEKGEIDVKAEEETITEPKPSIEEQQGKARPPVSLEPTGKLDPTNAEDAAEIINQARKFNEGKDIPIPIAFGGIFKGKLEKGEFVITEITYSHEQVDQAYRTLQTEIESPQEDVSLFSMPGKEKQLEAIGKKMAKMKKMAQKKRHPSVRKKVQLPKAKTKKEDFVKAISVASAKEASKGYGLALTGVKVEGGNLVATDGRRMFIAKGKWGVSGIYTDKSSLSKGLFGQKVKDKELNFPKWQDIVPDYSKDQAITISSTAVNNDLPTVYRRIKQASLITTEESGGVVVLLNKDGSLGFAARAPEVGHAEINISIGAKILGAANPHFLMEALEYHSIRGDKSIDFYFPFPDRQIMMIGPHGETKTIIMPVTAGEPSTELKKELGIAEEKPKTKGEKKPTFQSDPTIEQTTKGKPGFAGVAGRPGGPTQKAWLDDAKVKSPDPGMEAFFQRTKKFGSQKASGLLGKIKAGFRERFKFTPHLPDLPEAAIARDIIRTMPEAHRAATEKAFEDYSKVLDGDGSTEVLSKTGLDLYAKKIFVEDFIVEAEAGRDVPGGFTFEQLQDEKSRIDDLMEKLPSVKRAHEARQALWQEVSNDLADRGVISEENAKNPHYVRHFVLEHMEGKQFAGTGRKKLKQPFRAYKLGRKGTIKDVSTDILEVDTHALAQIKSDNAVEDAANEIANRYADKKNEGKEGFVEWHYKRPNMYYRAQTFDGSKLAQMVEGAADEVDVTIPKAMLREALVLGRKRKGLIIPRWLADQLDDLPVNKRSGYVVDSFTKPFIKWWKRYILRVNPFRYNRRNLVGDSERLNAAGRTHAFVRTGEAIKILWNKEGEIYDRARELGVIGTSLWHEMGTAHRQRIFERFKKVKNMSMFKMATAPLRKTVDVVSAVGQAEQDMTQAREDILRLAVFLDALDDVDNFAAGKPTRYGPNIRHWAGWNQDVEAIAKTDRFRAAAKVSRETMVDYGDFTPWENDVLRQGLVPFWSFMKKNVQFWPHAIKEAAKEGGAGRPLAIAGTKAGWNLGKWAVRALGIYGVAYLWNHRDDEADKKDDALPPWLRTRPHLNVGGGTLWEQTALSDFTEWFNVDDIAGDLQRFESGYITFEELMKATALNTAKGPVNKIAQGLSPFLKAPVTVLGHKTFPDVFKPRQFAQAWSSKALKEAALEVIGTDVKRFIRTQSGDVTVKEALAYYLYGSMYRDTSPEELEKQIRRSLEFTTLKKKSPTTGRFPGQAKSGRERQHEILKARLKAVQGANK